MSVLGGLANAIGLGDYAAQQSQGTAGLQGVIQGGAYHGQFQNSLLHQQYNQAKLAQQREIDDFDPNKNEAWAMPMSALVNLWRAKFLDEWVIVRSYEMEPFWQAGFMRLHRANKFEESPGQWVRLKEDA